MPLYIATFELWTHALCIDSIIIPIPLQDLMQNCSACLYIECGKMYLSNLTIRFEIIDLRTLDLVYSHRKRGPGHIILIKQTVNNTENRTPPSPIRKQITRPFRNYISINYIESPSMAGLYGRAVCPCSEIEKVIEPYVGFYIHTLNRVSAIV